MYDELLEVWRREKENSELQNLQKDFYTRLINYVQKIREERRMIDEESVRGKLLRREEEYTVKMISDLIRTRYEKIIRLITRRELVPVTALAEEEGALYNGLSNQVESYESFLRDILQGQKPRIKYSRTKGFLVVRLLKEMPQIIGADMRVYGPFKPEDIATLPEENAKALIKQGVAVEVDIR